MLSALHSFSTLMACCTARSDRQVRSAIFATEGQHTPSSFALSARLISTAFCAGVRPWSGQQADMMIVLTDSPPATHFLDS
ncbi:hypothetical protein AN449_31820 [Pseudomonas aeruginosa]|nr:hypothetical protein F22031_19455 [Pseudomonas aeruginosa]KRU70360.1 hypothetical protein AN449_31820 [Pseudomonas aeruginosa]RIY67580.1 hypothetical protein AXW90_06405 [Pseudomonas aeruginosa]RIY69176.1 hypothetical protein AXW91_06395 [Pseudomonas aeruginosa]